MVVIIVIKKKKLYNIQNKKIKKSKFKLLEVVFDKIIKPLKRDIRLHSFIAFPHFLRVDCDSVNRAVDKMGCPVGRRNLVPGFKVAIEALKAQAHKQAELVFRNGRESGIGK